MNYSLTVAMTPSFYMKGDNLLRAQLKCLSNQVFKDFDVLLIDCHYQKRKGYMAELADKYALRIVHVPYTPNLLVAKKLDCAIFNAPYLFSTSENIVRLSCWRFVRPDFTKICSESSIAVDFRFHNVQPPIEHAHPESSHDVRVWDGESDKVNWDFVPMSCKESNASWGSDSDRDAGPQIFPLNCYGNYMVPRREWLRLNGCDEAIFSSEHWEDQDFCQRANTAGIPAWRKAHVMYRMHHQYGSHSGRSNIQPDFGSFREICEKCAAVEHNPKPERRDLKRRIANGELLTFDQNRVWVCKTCSYCGPVFHADEGEYFTLLRRRDITRSNIIPMMKLGRNLEVTAHHMDKRSDLAYKLDVFSQSYFKEEFYKI